MTWFHVCIARIRAWVQATDEDRELDAELEAHVAMAMDEHRRRGLTPEQARRAARLELGGLSQLREAHRQTRGLPQLDVLLQDLRYAGRTLRRDPAFTLFAVLIIGLGIGASTTVFSLINALILRPLPFQDTNRLIWIANTGGDGVSEWQVEPQHFRDLVAQNRSCLDVTGYNAFVGHGDQQLTGDGEPARASAVAVTENFFRFFGVQPILGRSFTPQDAQPQAPRVVLLQHGFWVRRYASDPTVVGRTITMNETPFTVIGVLPASFDFGSVFSPGSQLDLVVPYQLTPQTGGGNMLAIIGRLRPDVSIEAARAEFTLLGTQLTHDHPERNPITLRVMPLNERVNAFFRPVLLVLSCAVGVVMLIVCANLSNLQLARLASRQQELAIRVALGAGRGRLIRQLLTESVLLSCCGAILGVALAALGTRVVSSLQTFNIPLLDRVQLDAAACGFLVLIAVIAGLIVGVMPALHVRTLTAQTALKASTRGASDGRAQVRLRGALVVSEMALACVLLVGAGLFMRSLLSVLDVTLGFRPEQVAMLRVDPGRAYSNRAKRNAYYSDLLGRVRQATGISGAALADVLPLDDDRGWAVGAEGQVYTREHPRQESFVRVVSDGYFQTMGIALQAGREFAPGDTGSGEPVAIINDVLARTLWPGEDPLRHRIVSAGETRRVIGVVAAVRHLGQEQRLTNEMYWPIRQTDDYGAVQLIVRTELPPAALASSVRAVLAPIAPDLPSRDWRTMQSLVDRSVSTRRFVVWLLTGFAAFALFLASLGIYGLIAYAVNRRRRELAIRLALGASPRELQTGILLQTLRLAALGLLVGAPASWLIGQSLTGLLFGVTPTDPVAFATMAGLLIGVATVAGFLPARRASRIDPIIALRN